MRIKYNIKVNFNIKRKLFILFIGIVMLCLGAILLPALLEYMLIAFFVILCGVIGINSKNANSEIWSYLITLPVFFSAFQNIYLGMAAYNLKTMELQILLSINILLFIEYLLIAVISEGINKEYFWGAAILTILICQSIVLFVVYKTTLTAFVSCFRNIVACMVIYFCSLKYYKYICINKFYEIVEKIIVIVLIFGFFEYIIGNQVWQFLNISKLWPLKGIAVNMWGLPKNWWSSERIAGMQLRRMVSSFADPVNLGTFLFSAFVLAWYRKKRIMQFFIVLACVLTVSKGAFLGFMIFIMILTWNKRNIKIIMPITTAFVVIIGMFFLSYSKESSSGSLFVHVDGFFDSLRMLMQYPLGRGVGNVGVLATMFNAGNSGTLDSAETGIGMIISQLGIVGLLTYIVFFLKIYLYTRKFDKSLQRELIASKTLIVAFFANALFNEVALSPNSCALYFMLIGIIQKRAIDVDSTNNHGENRHYEIE